MRQSSFYIDLIYRAFPHAYLCSEAEMASGGKKWQASPICLDSNACRVGISKKHNLRRDPMNAMLEFTQEPASIWAAPEKCCSPVIEVGQLHKFYSRGATRVHALRGVSLEVLRGEFLSIVGTSGSGKSTFLNLLGCLDRPSEGHYRLEGTDVSQLTAAELAHIRNERVGFVFQGFNLLSGTTAVENVELPLLYAGLGAKERRRRSREALRRVNIEDRADHIPSQLSDGQQQRIAIARALANKPSILLADEPTGNLDSRTSVEIMEIFQELNEQDDLTIILVTHEPDIALFGKRVITFRDGSIVRNEPVTRRHIAHNILAV
jgi:putative ABC transport system ATP-binding protein